MITHRVIGEIAFRRWGRLRESDLGPFLLGCILVDVHFCGLGDRLETHFAERLDVAGPHALDKSVDNFLAQLDTLLLRPWEHLAPQERAFVAGYVCHLAADEEWKRVDVATMRALGCRWWRDLPTSPHVVMTAFDHLACRLSPDPARAVQALAAAQVPDLFAHIPHAALLRMWEWVRPHALDGDSIESYLALLGRLGRSQAQVAELRRLHAQQWDDALALIHDLLGGVPARIEAMVAHALAALGRLDI